MRDLFHIYNQLRVQRSQLRTRLQHVRRDAMHRQQPLEADFAEQATQRENDEALAAIEASTAADLAQVEHALERFDQGKYGICETCEMRIDEQRMQALPQATTCACCAGGEARCSGNDAGTTANPCCSP